MRQEINALWYNFVFNAARSGMMNTYMNVDPNRVENAPKTFSYLKKLKENILIKISILTSTFRSLILNADDQVDLKLLAAVKPIHFV